MSTQVLIQKLNKELAELKNDVREVKEFLLAPLKDAEGEYKESYVTKILLHSQKGGRLFRFTNHKNFIKHVQIYKKLLRKR